MHALIFLTEGDTYSEAVSAFVQKCRATDFRLHSAVGPTSSVLKYDKIEMRKYYSDLADSNLIVTRWVDDLMFIVTSAEVAEKYLSNLPPHIHVYKWPELVTVASTDLLFKKILTVSGDRFIREAGR